MKVRLAPEAEADLDEIAEYVARDSPRSAVKLAAELQDASLALGRYPHRYPEVVIAGHPLRRRPTGQYAIYYFVDDDAVHAALLFPDD